MKISNSKVIKALQLMHSKKISRRAAASEAGTDEATIRYYVRKYPELADINSVDVPLSPLDKHVGVKKLFFDLETTPLEGFVWGLWNQNLQLNRIIKDWRLICFSYKWAHEDIVFCESLHHYVDKKYLTDEKDPVVKMLNIIISAIDRSGLVKSKKDLKKINAVIESELLESGLYIGIEESTLLGEVFFSVERKLVEKLWDLLDEADIVIAHNAKKFDVKRSKAKFIEHGMKPPAPFKVVDTLSISKENFGFTSQKLQYITDILLKGSKLETNFSLWSKVQVGDVSAYEYMEKYCDQDIRELEAVYNEIAPWDKKAPNVSLHVDDEEMQCIVCGSKDIEEVVGKFAFTGLSKFKTYKCGGCGKHSRGRENLLSKEKKSKILMNII